MSLQDFASLAEAHSHKETKGRMTSPDMVVSLLTENDSVITLQDKAKTDTKAAGFLLALNGSVSEYNLITGHYIGGKQQLLLIYVQYLLILKYQTGLMTEAQKVSLLALALKSTYPHANATQADFDRAKGLMAYTQAIQQTNGFIKLTVSADCEAHRPQILAVVQGINTQVGTAPVISNVGEYLARVPTNHSSYIVENYYGVIS